ncbi:MAG: hypothetical protein AAF252_02860 [Pseudomonadota bacterium]
MINADAIGLKDIASLDGPAAKRTIKRSRRASLPYLPKILHFFKPTETANRLLIHICNHLIKKLRRRIPRWDAPKQGKAAGTRAASKTLPVLRPFTPQRLHPASFPGKPEPAFNHPFLGLK